MNEELVYDRNLCQTCIWHRCTECWNNPLNRRPPNDRYASSDSDVRVGSWSETLSKSCFDEKGNLK